MAPVSDNTIPQKKAMTAAVGDIPDVYVWLFTGVVGLWTVKSWFQRSSQSIDKKVPPLVDFSSRALGSPHGPMLLREAAKTVSGKAFYLKDVPPWINFCVAWDYRVARSVLEDPKSTKPSLAYLMFDQTAAAANSTFFCSEGARFSHVRKSTNPAFASKNVERMTGIIENLLSEWIETHLEPVGIASNEAIVVDKEMSRLTMRIIGRVAFDYQFTPEEVDRLAYLVKTCYIEFSDTCKQSLLRALPFTAWMFASNRYAHKCARELKKKFADILDAHRQCPNPNPNSILYLIANDDGYANDEERAADMVLYFVGGYDTSSYTITWALLELARHLEEQTRLYKALCQCPTDDAARQSAALKRVVRETHRLHPTVALGSMRQVQRDISVPDSDMVIPAKSWVDFPFYLMHRDGDVFENPDSFVPSRWEDPDEAVLKAFMPFSLGRRGCQGQVLATAEVYGILARLCRSYEFTVEDPGEEIYYVTLKSVGTKLRVQRRSK